MEPQRGRGGRARTQEVGQRFRTASAATARGVVRAAAGGWEALRLLPASEAEEVAAVVSELLE